MNPHVAVRRVATPEHDAFVTFRCRYATQTTLSTPPPWAEAHGYRRKSLRDMATVGSRYATWLPTKIGNPE